MIVKCPYARRWLIEIMDLIMGNGRRTKLTDALGQLRSMGYHVDDGMIAIDYEPQDNGKAEMESIQQEAIEQRNVKRMKFRKALFDVLSAQTVDEARAMVERVIA